ncbi:MAG TPA: DUF4129 domain-containing protein [Polyangiales bacterium]|nr:DUF4129 domain-containing protein [Polyangiales bacterium]
MAVRTAELTAAEHHGASLHTPGPTEILDRALYALRSGPLSRVGRGLLAGVPLACVCLALYYLEVIEGVRVFRPLFAFAMALGFVFRALTLSRLSRSLVHEFRAGLPLYEAARGDWLRLTWTAAVAGLGVWVWLWPLAWLAQFSPFAMVALVPLLALRGGVAPSWLARASCAAESGWRAWGLASDDAAGARATLVFVELMLLVGTLGVFLNLYALSTLLLLLSNSVLGLDVAFVSAFVSLENEFMAYAVLGVSLMLADPLRAAVSACVFADARGRKDGADLHAAVDRLLALSGTQVAPPPRAASAAQVALLALVLSGVAGVARADSVDDAAPQVEIQRDSSVRAAVERILKRREFGNFDATGERTFETWLREQLDRLVAENQEERDEPSSLRVQLPDVSPWLVMGIVFGLLLLAVGYVTWDARGRDDPQPVVADIPQAPRISERPAPLLISDARELAAAGDFGAALRMLYAATLAALDRAHLIQFDPAKTNGHYHAHLPAGALRDAFGAFTAMFDRKWYGRESTSKTEYERGLGLAEQICATESKRP